MHAMSIAKDRQLGKSTIGTTNYSPRNLSRNLGSFPSFTSQQRLPGSNPGSNHKVLTKRGSLHQMVVDTGTISARLVQKTANQVMDVANVTKDAAMQVGKKTHGAVTNAAVQTAKIAVASGKTSKKLSVKAPKAAAKKAGKVKQKLEAAVNQTYEKQIYHNGFSFQFVCFFS